MPSNNRPAKRRRQKQDVRLAITESTTRVRADLEALSDKVDQLSRRNVLSCAGRFLLAVVAGVVVNHLPGGRTQNPRQEGRDVTFSVTSDHGVRGAGTPQIANGRHHRVNAGPATWSFHVPAVSSVTVCRGAAGLRV